MAVSSTITAEQDAPPTRLVLYGSRYNPIVVHLSRITDGGNKALEKNGRDFNRLVFLVDLRKSR